MSDRTPEQIIADALNSSVGGILSEDARACVASAALSALAAAGFIVERRGAVVDDIAERLTDLRQEYLTRTANSQAQAERAAAAGNRADQSMHSSDAERAREAAHALGRAISALDAAPGAGGAP